MTRVIRSRRLCIHINESYASKNGISCWSSPSHNTYTQVLENGENQPWALLASNRSAWSPSRRVPGVWPMKKISGFSQIYLKVDEVWTSNVFIAYRASWQRSVAHTAHGFPTLSPLTCPPTILRWFHIPVLFIFDLDGLMMKSVIWSGKNEPPMWEYNRQAHSAW